MTNATVSPIVPISRNTRRPSRSRSKMAITVKVTLVTPMKTVWPIAPEVLVPLNERIVGA